ncbi:von Willebrand factor type A domain-containing protein, partial [Roridomyces roridus]
MALSLHHRGFLPLLRVQASATIKELAAQVTLVHTYENEHNWPLEATYTFPVPARAVVCKFAMIRGDGTRVDGVVQERKEARETYEAALVQGHGAALVEQQTPDVFSIAVGNIHPRETVQIELVYATVLTEDEENNSVRFHLPMSICQRFGYSPIPYSIPASSAFLDIVVDLEAVSPIVHIGSPSHSISLQLGPDPFLPDAAELPFSHYARVMLSSASDLDRDFVLTMRSAGLDAPRCVAEIHPFHRTVALALSVVPRFKLPDIPRQEFIFLVDRSGSMRGQRIAALHKALVVMLRSLPAQGTLFQIASFGSSCTMLWEGSRTYNQETLDEATAHVDGMQANYGGTQIRAALARCFGSRRTDRPTSVFLLTDGAAWDVGSVLEEVKTGVASCSTDAYLRVSVLGIGSAAATDMCEGIARVGNGTCVLVTEEETSFTGKIARMLRAARTPLLANITVDWGVDVVEERDDDDEFVVVSGEEDEHIDKGKEKEKTLLSMFDETFDPLQLDLEPVPPPPPVALPPLSRIQQSPFRLQTINPANRLNLYCITQDNLVPKAVTLVGATAEGTEIRLVVPVTLSNLPNAPDSAPVLHALAARKIIQDLEDGQHALARSVPDDCDLLARTVHASIARLGTMYSISSSQTSFVVVDDS